MRLGGSGPRRTPVGPEEEDVAPRVGSYPGESSGESQTLGLRKASWDFRLCPAPSSLGTLESGWFRLGSSGGAPSPSQLGPL